MLITRVQSFASQNEDFVQYDIFRQEFAQYVVDKIPGRLKTEQKAEGYSLSTPSHLNIIV